MALLLHPQVSYVSYSHDDYNTKFKLVDIVKIKEESLVCSPYISVLFALQLVAYGCT